MALWFLRGLRRGVVTTHYPATPPDDWTHTLDGPPMFRPSMLTSELVDALVDICPGGALVHGEGELIYDLGACTACGRCGAFAPDVVVRTSQQELAATERDHLIKRIPILGDHT